MKKTIFALALIIAFATASFASVSFLTAPGIGEGKIAVLGLYGTNHNGNIGGADSPQNLDATSLGVRGCYGLMKDLDLLVAYSMDTLVNIKDIEEGGKQTAGNTSSLGVKYAVIKDGATVQGMVVPMDVAVSFGIETSTATIKADNIKSTGIGNSAMILGAIFSKKIDNMVPYGAIAYKMLTQNLGGDSSGKIDPVNGIGIALNIGLMYGIAADQAIAIEYNTEAQAYGDLSSNGKAIKDSAYSTSVSGISLGYVYMF